MVRFPSFFSKPPTTAPPADPTSRTKADPKSRTRADPTSRTRADPTSRTNRSRTKAELELFSLLEPFGLIQLEWAVRTLAATGNRASTLLGLTDTSLQDLGFDEPADRQRIMLAGWLESVGMAEHGGGLVRCGVGSLEKMAKATDDATLKAAGVFTMGPRRRLQRHVRSELSHLADRLFVTELGMGMRWGAEMEWEDGMSVERLHKLANREGYDQQWRVTSTACLHGGAAHGNVAVADYYDARTPCEGDEWRLVSGNGRIGQPLNCR